LWKSADKAPLAADAMGITSESLKEHELIDEIIAEPQGGAHRDIPAATANVKASLLATLDQLEAIPMDELLEKRYERLMSYGAFAD